MVFTREEFDIMVEQLLYAEPVSFDMLCQIAQQALTGKVRYWCNQEAVLRNRGYEEDILQEIYIRLIKTAISGFFLKKCTNGDFNNDPEGFEDWMFKVALNVKKDFVRRLRNNGITIGSLDELEKQWLEDRKKEELQVRIQRLGMAFSIALSADVSVYKVLIWLAQFVYILECNMTKIESNEQIITAFSQATLEQMYEKLRTMSGGIPWVQITERQDQRIRAALAKPCANSCYGQMRLQDFYMKHNAQVCAKKSISDWSNRMNNMIRRKLKKNTANRKNAERGQTDDPSDN